VQLTSLRPTADAFCTLLRDALKIELQKGQMKTVRGFAKTCFSESLITEPATAENEERAGTSSATDGGDEITYHGGLGLKFKFPGDPKKCALSPILDRFMVLTSTCHKTTRSIKTQIMDSLSQMYALS
jgi:hypothetical protein